jgi:hypothetical protein
MNSARKIWGLRVLWLWHREPSPPRVIVVFVDATTGTITAAAPHAVAIEQVAQALPQRTAT